MMFCRVKKPSSIGPTTIFLTAVKKYEVDLIMFSFVLQKSILTLFVTPSKDFHRAF